MSLGSKKGTCGFTFTYDEGERVRGCMGPDEVVVDVTSVGAPTGRQKPKYSVLSVLLQDSF